MSDADIELPQQLSIADADTEDSVDALNRPGFPGSHAVCVKIGCRVRLRSSMHPVMVRWHAAKQAAGDRPLGAVHSSLLPMSQSRLGEAIGVVSGQIRPGAHRPIEPELYAAVAAMGELLVGLSIIMKYLLRSTEESPIPETELSSLERVLGVKSLSSLVGISPSSLRHDVVVTYPAPEAVAARLNFLSLAVEDLAGSYNEIGVRRWFTRSRTQLGAQAPVALLSGGAWSPEDEGPTRVRQLAASLRGGKVT